MRLTTSLTLGLALSLSALTPVLGERTAQQIVSDANKLLSEGSYVQAARAYGDAIGNVSTMDSADVRSRPDLVYKLLQAGYCVSLAGQA